MPYMVKIAQLMIPQPPWGRKYRYFLRSGKVGQSSFFVKFDTTMPYMVKIAQLMIPQPPWGRKYRYFCDPSSHFRDTAVFNFKW